jgi:hypothetical protein
VCAFTHGPIHYTRARAHSFRLWLMTNILKCDKAALAIGKVIELGHALLTLQVTRVRSLQSCSALCAPWCLIVLLMTHSQNFNALFMVLGALSHASIKRLRNVRVHCCCVHQYIYTCA